MRIEEYALRTGISMSTAWKWIREGKIPTTKDFANRTIVEPAFARSLPPAPDLTGFVPAADYAKSKGVTLPTVKNWVRDGRIDHIRTMNGRVYVNPNTFKEHLASMRTYSSTSQEFPTKPQYNIVYIPLAYDEFDERYWKKLQKDKELIEDYCEKNQIKIDEIIEDRSPEDESKILEIIRANKVTTLIIPSIKGNFSIPNIREILLIQEFAKVTKTFGIISVDTSAPEPTTPAAPEPTTPAAPEPTTPAAPELVFQEPLDYCDDPRHQFKYIIIYAAGSCWQSSRQYCIDYCADKRIKVLETIIDKTGNANLMKALKNYPKADTQIIMKEIEDAPETVEYLQQNDYNVYLRSEHKF